MIPAKSRPLVGKCAAWTSRCMTRLLAVQTSRLPNLQVFSRRTKQLQKERAAMNTITSRQADYLRDEVAIRLSERLLDIDRRFDHVLDLGANSCNIARALTLPNPDPDPSKAKSPSLATRVSRMTAVDSSRRSLFRDADLPFNDGITLKRDVVHDEESLPYQADTFDAVMSSLSMHWINDLPSLLSQTNKILKPDCPFIAAMFGGDTLFELRTTLQLADVERRGGVTPHVSPLADVKDIGGLLQAAGFKMLTVDVDDIVVDYPDTFALMQDLQAMGEGNAILVRQEAGLKRDVMLASEGIYRELYGNPDGTLPATFRMIYMIGWKEGPHQAQPLSRGTGQVNIKDILGGGEVT